MISYTHLPGSRNTSFGEGLKILFVSVVEILIFNLFYREVFFLHTI
jgi:hypothetical protein